MAFIDHCIVHLNSVITVFQLNAVYQNEEGFKEAVALDYIPVITVTRIASAQVPYTILFESDAPVVAQDIEKTFENVS